MSTWLERLGRRRGAAASQDDAGFTLLEVVVALILIGLVSAALVPVLISSSRSEQHVKQVTVAKNTAQERIDSMRQLPYHVDRQNGQYRDLLDDYYPDVNTTAHALGWCTNCTGQWVQSGTIPGSSATGPYYQVTFTNPYSQSGFTQTVYTQFLTSSQPVPAVLAASALTGVSYDSNVVGHDQPPSLLVGVTVVTSWTDVGGSAHSYRSFTQITKSGTDASLIVSEAQATALEVSATAADGTLMRAQVGNASAQGSLADSSSASTEAEGAAIFDNGAGIESGKSTSVSPPNPAGSTAAAAVANPAMIGSTGTCGWGAFGKTQVSDVSSTTDSGLPVAPSDYTTASPKFVQASLLATGANCSGFQFSNQIDGSASTDSALQLPSASPMVQIADASGDGALASGDAAVYATSSGGTPGAVTAKASVSFTKRVQIFPGLSFVLAGQSVCGPDNAQPCGNGLVNIFLSAASLTCSSGSSVAGSYSGYVTYYTKTGWHSVTLSWSSGTTSTDPLASVNLSQVVTTNNGVDIPLSAYIQSWSSAQSISTATGSLSTLSGIVALTTQPTRGSSDPASSIGVDVGDLSCVATDSR